MRRILGGLALSALIAVGADDISAQRGGGRPGSGMRRGQSVEAIMQMRDRLELTDDQLANLESLRSETVSRRNAERAEVAEMHSRFSAGQIQRSDVMAFMEDRQEADPGVAEQHGRQRERLSAILNEAQLESLAEMQTRGRASARGRMNSGRGGAGMRRSGNSRGGGAPRGGRFDRQRGHGGDFRGARGSARGGPPMGRGFRRGRGG